jgi:hypothetical protein
MVDPLTLGLFGGAVLVSMVVGTLTDKERLLKRRLRKAPLRSIKHLPDRRWARYVGKVDAIAEPLLAPLTGRACTFWSVVVEEHGRNTIRTVLRRDQGKDFCITDDSGTMLVRVEGARLAVARDGRFSSGVLKDPTPELERFLAQNGVKTKGWFFNRKLTYHEAVIEPGEAVAVAGIAHAEAVPRTADRADGEAVMRLVLRGDRASPVLITDDPKLAKPPRAAKAV